MDSISDRPSTPVAPASVPFLSQQVLDRLAITTREVVDCIERHVLGQRRGTVWCAPKAVVLPGDERYMMATLGVASEPSVVVTKSLALNPRNPARGLPVINGLVTVLDGETGVPLAVVDANWVTAVRTAGLSALAAKYLARPDAASIGFVGCGVQARSHLDAFCDLFPVREIRAFGRGAANRDALCRAAEARGVAAIASATARDAITDVDLVVTSVPLMPAPPPFLDARWLKPGAFVAMVDLALPWLPESLSAIERIVIDDQEQEAKMTKPMVAAALVAGDLTNLVCGEIAARTDPQQRTAFAFRGMAVGDLAIAGLAYVRAQASGRAA